jgi:hypothetical protein
MKFTIYQEPRTGKRANNEDRLAYCYSREALLMVVADGMGGHYYGEVAAQIAVQTLTEAFPREFRRAFVTPSCFCRRACSTPTARFSTLPASIAWSTHRAPPASPASSRTTSPTGRTRVIHDCICCAMARCWRRPGTTRAYAIAGRPGVISEDADERAPRPQQDLRLPGWPADAGDRVFAQGDPRSRRRPGRCAPTASGVAAPATCWRLP